MMRPRFALLAILIFAAILHPPAPAGGGRAATLPGGAAAAPDLPILFETAYPLNELLPSGWTDAQKKEILYFAERMKIDDRIFLLVQVSTDPIGSEGDNGKWGIDMAQAVARRLRAGGIPPDRILIAPGGRDTSLFGNPTWERFAPLQKVTIRGLRGGAWLKRRELATAVRDELPPSGTIRILEPSEGKTDRAHHVLRGTAEDALRNVAVVIGEEAQTVAVYDGKFEVPVSLRPGANRIVVTGLDRFGRAIRAAREILYVPPRPTIDMASPAQGVSVDVSRSPVISVRGTVRSKTPLDGLFLIQNDFPRRIPFRPDGTFEQRAVLITEEDVFSIEALDRGGETGVSAPRKVAAQGIAERPLMAILHWDEDDVDVDLHVTDAVGRHTFFDAPDVLSGASAIPSAKLWLDNRQGYGPEIFSVEENAPGTYTFDAEYYRGRKACRAYLTIVLFAGSPSRKMVRVLGPIVLSPSKRSARLARIVLPAGTVQEPANENNR